MASYHFAAQVISRGQGRSAIAAAAYRAGERLADEATGRVSDYSQRRGVVHSEIMAPDGTAPHLQERQNLWNAVEAGEKRKDAQLAREINLALPHELDDAGRRDLVRSFVAREFVARGMIADVAIHAPVAEKGDDPRNHHAHIMLTLRQVDVDTGQFFRIKTREWNSDAMLTHWRESWAAHQNEVLTRRRLHERVDHRSLKAQRTEALGQGEHGRARILDREPEIHIGPQARAAVRGGHRPESRDRTVNLRQPQRESHDRVRTVEYSRIDRGRTRFEANLERIQRNLSRFDHRLTHTQIRHQRWHQQLAWMGASPSDHELQRLVRERSRQRQRDFAAIFESIRAPGFATSRQRRLKAVVPFGRSFIEELLGVKTRHLKRKRELVRSLGNERVFGRSKGRGWERPPARS